MLEIPIPQLDQEKTINYHKNPLIFNKPIGL
jgi:hypothetical protein